MLALESSLNAERTKMRSRTLSGVRETTLFRSKVETESNKQASSSRYPEVKSGKLISWVAFGIAVAAHAIFLFGFGGKKVAAPVASVTRTTEVVLFQAPMPEEEMPVETTDFDGENVDASAGLDVPSLPDLPTTVNLTDFVQPVQMTAIRPQLDVSAARLSHIPTGFGSGGAGGSGNGLGNLFNLSDLDRAPTPVYRPLPSIPQHLLKVATGVSVTVQFVVSAKGEVLNAHVISSDNARFDDVAIAAVKKWKFKPGYRQGRTVNVSMNQAIDFKVTGS